MHEWHDFNFILICSLSQANWHFWFLHLLIFFLLLHVNFMIIVGYFKYVTSQVIWWCLFAFMCLFYMWGSLLILIAIGLEIFLLAHDFVLHILISFAPSMHLYHSFVYYFCACGANFFFLCICLLLFIKCCCIYMCQLYFLHQKYQFETLPQSIN